MKEGVQAAAIDAAWATLHRHLRARLCTLEREFAEKVRVCKQKDEERGRLIIPDYSEVNASAAQQRESSSGLDKFMAIASRRANYVRVLDQESEGHGMS